VQGFVNALDEFQRRRVEARLTTGCRELDRLLGGGLEHGLFYLFYGDEAVDSLIHRLLVSSLQSVGGEGFEARALYMNCGNYREEKTILDTQLLCSIMKALGMDPLRGLDRIQVLCAFSEEQQEEIVEEARKVLEDNPEVNLIVVHHVAKLFTGGRGSLRERMRRIQRLQQVVSKLRRTAAQRGVFLAATCRPTSSLEGGVPRPEGGKYLRHLAGAIVYLRRVRREPPGFSAHLVKHPSLKPGRTLFTLNFGGGGLGRITAPFNIVLRDVMRRLKRKYLRALKEPSRREAFERLLEVWSSEKGAINNAETPTALDAMLLTAVVDNRRLIEEVAKQVEKLLREG